MDRRTQNRGNNSRQVCRQFQRTGRCRFNDSCKFSHDATQPTINTSTTVRAPDDEQFLALVEIRDGTLPASDDEGTIELAKLRQWKKLLNHGKHDEDENLDFFAARAKLDRAKQSDGPEFASVSQFFGLGLELVKGDTHTFQEIIQLLARAEGLDFIKAATDRHLQAANNLQAKVDLMSQQILPFLGIITQNRVVASNVLERDLATIYTFLVGDDASRVIRLSTFVLELAAASGGIHLDDLDLLAAFEVLLSALSKAIDLSTTEVATQNFQRILEQFSHLLEAFPGAQADISGLQATKYLEYLQRRMKLANTLANTAAPKVSPGKNDIPVLGKDSPGLLRENGPRHDNDHEDISKIRILPTSEEIDATGSDYLPTNKSSEWHIPGIRGRIDREFRLLREDTVGQLRNEVRRVRQLIRTSGNRGGPTTSFRYGDAVVHELGFNKSEGLEFTVRCKQPANVLHMGDAAREHWWETCKRLQSGNLVCILDPSEGSGKVQFFVISDSTLRSKSVGDNAQRPDRRARRRDDYEDQANDNPLRLSYSREHLYVKLNLVESTPADLGPALEWSRGNGSMSQRYLVEFPQALLASFKHTLEALQQLSRKSDLPFTELIAPEMPTSGGEAKISPPLFSRAPGFSYDLSCLTTNKKPLGVGIGRVPTAVEVSSRTGLDMTQAEALLSTLSREFSLIQGPPGTGKSYTGEKIIQALLANKAKAELGPIICVCYTNHALDQLLEHLLDNGIKSVIRIGSQSKSERVQDLNLNNIVRTKDKTTVEKGYSTEAMNKMTTLTYEINQKLGKLASCESGESFAAYLRSNHIDHFKELFPGRAEEVNSGGWNQAQASGTEDAVVQLWLQGGKKSGHVRARSVVEKSKLKDMTQQERGKIHQARLSDIRNSIITDIIQLQAAYDKAKAMHEQIRREVRSRCIEGADVVGMTTSGAARELTMLRKLSSKVLICEEAGEVLESHILTSLLPSLQQAILIGDHLQLRPQINNFDLESTNPKGEPYSLDMSLFERLVRPPHSSDHKLPFSTLLTQRRMYPSIAQMVRSTLYPKLQDAENVKVYPEVVGMGRRLFWFDHGRQEDRGMTGADSTSRSNQFEVEMAASLVSHIVKQGEYRPQDIAVLTPYSGQLQKLRWRLEKELSLTVDIGERDLAAISENEAKKAGTSDESRNQVITEQSLFDSIRLATVDNFQGEEAKIIIISLVRSNPERVCGFLKTSNRINVLLSRAMHGCYIIGDSRTYSHVGMWDRIIKLLKAGGNFGNALQLQCARHPKTALPVASPEHFASLSPDGGCKLPCDRLLTCGHACYGLCHSDMLHQAIFCHQRCKRTKTGCDHICREECGYDCEEECNIILKDISLQLPCGHTVESATCWETRHPADVQCLVEVLRIIPECDHILKMPCHVDVATKKITCESACGETLACGHACQLPCHQCLKPQKDTTLLVRKCRGVCKEVCGRAHEGCSHRCSRPCHRRDCGRCEEPCEVRCSHSRCLKQCHERCVPCAEQDCASHCPHSKCGMPCAAPCDWVPCSKRCTLSLSCGHQCPSICGETCPDASYCQQCGSADTLSTVVDLFKRNKYTSIDLNKDPCVFAACGHFLTRSFMDAKMGMAEHYDLGNIGTPTAIKAASKPFSKDGAVAKTCPQCPGSLRNISRYGRIVRRPLLDEATKQFIISSERQHLELAERLLQEEKRLACQDMGRASPRDGEISLTGSVSNQLLQMSQLFGHDQCKEIMNIYGDLSDYRDKMRAEDMPFQKVAKFVEQASRDSTIDAPVFDTFVIQTRAYQFATALMLKCNVAILSAFLKWWKKNMPSSATCTVEFADNLAQCHELITLAHDTSRPLIQAEGCMYAAAFCGFTLALDGSRNVPVSGREKLPDYPLRQTGLSLVGDARTLITDWRKATNNTLDASLAAAEEKILDAGIGAAEHLLSNTPQVVVKKQPMPFAELRAVYGSRAWDFSPTGNWYVCERGHAFTVGMSSEKARCPECGSSECGKSQGSARSLKPDKKVEKLARGVGGMRM